MGHKKKSQPHLLCDIKRCFGARERFLGPCYSKKGNTPGCLGEDYFLSEEDLFERIEQIEALFSAG